MYSLPLSLRASLASAATEASSATGDLKGQRFEQWEALALFLGIHFGGPDFSTRQWPLLIRTH